MVSKKLKAPRRRRSITVAPDGPITGVRRSRSFVATWYSLANSMTRSSTRSSLNAPTRTGGPRQSHLLPFTRGHRAADSRKIAGDNRYGEGLSAGEDRFCDDEAHAVFSSS